VLLDASEPCIKCHFCILILLRKSKEEYEEEMSRRLLLDEEVGSTSSSCSDKPMAESSRAQNASTYPCQQSSTAEVRHQDQDQADGTCKTSMRQMGPVKPV